MKCFYHENFSHKDCCSCIEYDDCPQRPTYLINWLVICLIIVAAAGFVYFLEIV